MKLFPNIPFEFSVLQLVSTASCPFIVHLQVETGYALPLGTCRQQWDLFSSSLLQAEETQFCEPLLVHNMFQPPIILMASVGLASVYQCLSCTTGKFGHRAPNIVSKVPKKGRFTFLNLLAPESQNHLGWKGPHEIILSKPPAQAVSARTGCPGPCQFRFWISPRMDHPHSKEGTSEQQPCSTRCWPMSHPSPMSLLRLYCVPSSRLLIKTLNSVDLCVIPWRTPLAAGCQLDFVQLITTLGVWQSSQYSICFITHYLTNLTVRW